MLPERWQELKREITDKFGGGEAYEEQLDHGSQEVVEFLSPMGRLKLCYVKTPKVLDKKTLYSNRIGSGVSVEYIYDPENFVYHLEVYRLSEEDNEWQKFENPNVFQ